MNKKTIITVDTLEFKMEFPRHRSVNEIGWHNLRDKIIEATHTRDIEKISSSDILWQYGIEDPRKCNNIELLENLLSACREYPSSPRGYNIIYEKVATLREQLEENFIPKSKEYIEQQEKQKPLNRLKRWWNVLKIAIAPLIAAIVKHLLR